MKKLNTSPISGMQELLPAPQATFDKLKTEIVRMYHLHGFQNIETPTIDRTEILLAKAGGDTEKQIYKVIKTAETADDASQALRFDHTVPLARYVVEHENELAFPFRVTQCGRNFRGERAQKGRFREFYQIDADIIGRGSLPIAYDAEVVATAVDALKTFITPNFVVRISNRKILAGLLREMGLETKSSDIASIIDHAEKVSPEKTHAAFEEIGLNKAEIATIEAFISIHGPRTEVIERLRNLTTSLTNAQPTLAANNSVDTTISANPAPVSTDSTSTSNPSDPADTLLSTGIEELDQVLSLLEAQGITNVIGDMLIIRGLDYYTGTVFETILPDYKQIGSICSGGRYDNLAGHYTDQALPGVGISIGLTRLFYVLNENNLLPESAASQPIDAAIIPLSENEYQFALQLARDLRAAGHSTDVVLTDKRLGDKMAHAARIANYAAVIGENEVKTGEIKFKNLTSGKIYVHHIKL